MRKKLGPYNPPQPLSSQIRIIFSRKGFDSSAGRTPSAILPDGKLVSFPIPDTDREQTRRYEDLRPQGVLVGQLLGDLMGSRYGELGPVHLDPDLDVSAVPRPEGWRPMFGQASAAESHLRKLGVTTGDLFLFFGWFRQVEHIHGAYQYVKTAPDLHCLFGWLQVGERYPVADLAGLPIWAREHPHVKRSAYDPQHDSIYVATERLELPGYPPLGPGGGVFPKFCPALLLTAAGHLRSRWRVPSWLLPRGRTPLSYHGKTDRWLADGETLHLRSVGRGQEFVLPIQEYPEAKGWIAELFGVTGVTGSPVSSLTR
jgi:hypothetical protein